MANLYSAIRPFFFMMDPETAHNTTIAALKSPLGQSLALKNVPKLPKDMPMLKQSLWQKNFQNPLGLAAGFDKNGAVIAPILKMGFGFTEIGSVTPRPQEGNPRPRIFRDTKNNAIINRMGFPNGGLHRFQENLTKYLEHRPRPAGLVGVNIGLNKQTMEKDMDAAILDYSVLLRALVPMADYMTVNISSPNTPNLRNFQQVDAFRTLISALIAERDKISGAHQGPAMLVKLAPDLSPGEQEELAGAALDLKLDGLILTNTTLARPDHLSPSFSKEKGGLSGQPLFDHSTQVLQNMYRLTEGKIPLIGVGGVENAQQAYAKIRSGATLVQLYSALIFKGPRIAYDIITGLQDLLEKDGLTHISQAIGVDVT